jgi:hypothetical protein
MGHFDLGPTILKFMKQLHAIFLLMVFAVACLGAENPYIKTQFTTNQTPTGVTVSNVTFAGTFQIPSGGIMNSSGSNFMSGGGAQLVVGGAYSGNALSSTAGSRYWPNGNIFSGTGGQIGFADGETFADTNGNVHAGLTGMFIGNGTGLTSLPAANLVGTGYFYGNFIGNGLNITNLQSTNIVGTIPISLIGTIQSTNVTFGYGSWTGKTNYLNVNNSYQLYVMTDVAAITNFIWNGTWAVLAVSNSTPNATNFYFNAPARAQGTATTNTLLIGAGKMGFISIVGSTGLFTNYMNTTQQ